MLGEEFGEGLGGPRLLPRLWRSSVLSCSIEPELVRSLVIELRHHLGPELGVRAEHAVVARHLELRRRDEGCEARAEVMLEPHERDRDIAPGLLEKVARRRRPQRSALGRWAASIIGASPARLTLKAIG